MSTRTDIAGGLLSRDGHIDTLKRNYDRAKVKTSVLLDVAAKAERHWRNAKSDEEGELVKLTRALEERENYLREVRS
jgi:hypothetical protein